MKCGSGWAHIVGNAASEIQLFKLKQKLHLGYLARLTFLDTISQRPPVTWPAGSDFMGGEQMFK